MKISDKLNSWVHPFFAWRVRRYYLEEVRNWERMHPESFGTVSSELKRKYEDLWNKIVPTPYDGWLRLLTKLSGQQDYRFVPSDAYYSVIERCLNNCDFAGAGIDDKNQMYKFVPAKYLPKAFLHYSRGVWFDCDFNPISSEAAESIAKAICFDVIGKVAVNSSGGHGVKCIGKGKINLDWIGKNFESYVIQEKVDQEPVAKSINPASVNTCRLVTFRRPWSGKTSVVAAMFRAGCGDAIVDNISSGGCSVDVRSNGKLADYGVDYDMGQVAVHPRSGLHFADVKLPFFREMCDAASETARKVLDYNIMGFDVVARPDGTPCIIEVNTTSLAAVEVQTGHPLFGDDTEQLVDWCVAHRDRLDRFSHIRTYY